MTDNERIVRGVYDAFNAKDFSAFEELYLPDAQMTSHAFNETMPVRDYMQNWMAGFPDGHIEVTNFVSGEPWCVAEFFGRGTHTGPLQTPQGLLEATNREVEIHMCELLRIENGKIAEARSYFDGASFIAQLGSRVDEGMMVESEAWQTETEQPVLH